MTPELIGNIIGYGVVFLVALSLGWGFVQRSEAAYYKREMETYRDLFHNADRRADRAVLQLALLKHGLEALDRIREEEVEEEP